MSQWYYYHIVLNDLSLTKWRFLAVSTRNILEILNTICVQMFTISSVIINEQVNMHKHEMFPPPHPQ